MVNVDGEKMSKSLGNFTTLADVLDRYDPRAFRLLVLQTHYRRQMEIGDEGARRRGEGGRAARRARPAGAPRASCRAARRGRHRPSSAPRWTTTSTRRPRVAVVFDAASGDANTALDDGERRDAAGPGRDRARARGARSGSSSTTTTPSSTTRSTRWSSARDAGAGRKDCGRGRPHPRRAAARGASCSRTRPNGTGLAPGVMPDESRRTRACGGEQVEGRRAVLELLRGAAAPGARPCHVSSTVRRRRGRRRDRRARGRPRCRSSRPERHRRDGAQRRAAGCRRDRGAVARPPTSTTCSTRPTRSSSRSTASPIRATSARSLRCAETAGATGVVLPRHRSARVTPVVAEGGRRRDRVPADRARRGHPGRARARARARVCGRVGLDERGERSLFDLDLADQPLVLVLGAEGRGLARLTRERCDVLVRIPMRGAIGVAQRRGRGRARVSRDRAAPRGVASGVLAGLAQLVEQLICNQQVVGSIPTPGSRHPVAAQSEMLVFRARGGQDRALMHIDLTERELACSTSNASGGGSTLARKIEIRARFDLSSSSYYRALQALIDLDAADDYDPLTVLGCGGDASSGGATASKAVGPIPGAGERAERSDGAEWPHESADRRSRQRERRWRGARASRRPRARGSSASR